MTFCNYCGTLLKSGRCSNCQGNVEPINDMYYLNGPDEFVKKPEGEKDIPIWYTANEMEHWLVRNNYSKEIAKELSEAYAVNLQGAFNKGFEKGSKKVEELREETWNEALDSGISKVSELMLAADPMFGVALYAVINELKALKK